MTIQKLALLIAIAMTCPAALAQDEIELMLQVNGKLRGKLRVPAGANQAAHSKRARKGLEFMAAQNLQAILATSLCRHARSA